MPATKLRKVNYPMGSVSCATMRPEDLIPEFLHQLEHLAKQTGILPAKQRKAHLATVREIWERTEAEDYYDSGDADTDLNEDLFDALNEYAGPYFYFGAHPGDGADYGYWLSEDWDQDFEEDMDDWESAYSIKVNDLSEVPSKFRGEVAVVSDHGNVTLYCKTSRALHEIWSVV